MKKITNILLVMTMLLIGFKYNNIYAESIDKKGPSCTIEIPNKVRVRKTINGYVLCYDESQIVKTNITKDDFFISRRLLSNAKITSVSNGYVSQNNSKYYRWDFQLKGTIIGTINLQLKPNVIEDAYGNVNSYSTTSVIKVKLF